MHYLKFAVYITSIFFTLTPANAQSFNEYVLKSVKYLYDNHKGGGYDIRKAFTHDVTYGSAGTIKATAPPSTMCVAGVAEVIIYATKIYAKESGDNSVFDSIPVSAWIKGTPTSLKANIFMFSGTGSRGTGHTLAEFGLGQEKRFHDLKPGDFINLNRRNGSGHAVVFLGYIKDNTTLTLSYSDDVIGFRYFSAQGKGRPDAGFAYRNAFFGSSCPSSKNSDCTDNSCPANGAVPNDCGVIRSDNRALLNAGQMWAPSRWAYNQAVKRRRDQSRSALEDANPGATRGAIDILLQQDLNRELQWTPDQERMFDMEEAQ